MAWKPKGRVLKLPAIPDIPKLSTHSILHLVLYLMPSEVIILKIATVFLTKGSLL